MADTPTKFARSTLDESARFLCGARELVVEFHIYDTDLGLGHDLEHELGRGRAPTGRHAKFGKFSGERF